MINIESDIKEINRLGAATAQKLKRLGIESARDLLFYFPFRYDDFSRKLPIAGLRPGKSANIVGRIELIQNRRSPRRRMYITEALVSDESGEIKAVWFNQPFLVRNLKAGDLVSLSGRPEEDYGGVVFKSPDYEKIRTGGAIHTQGLVPVYHLTANLTEKQLRFLIKSVIFLAPKIPDWLPAEVKKRIGLLNLNEAVKKIHFPSSAKDTEKARRRLAFDELFLVQLQSQLIKRQLRKSRAEKIIFQEEAVKKFVSSLPFKLTDAQRRAAWEIILDLAKERPMARLMIGEVGSGKTVVALLAMFNTALNNKQAVLLAPTEILARQHFSTISRLLAGLDIKIGLITGSEKKLNNLSDVAYQENEKISYNAEQITQNAKIIIGTHALIQEKIIFQDLTLAVIDEQHRFGVEQRKALLQKSGGKMPHLLSLTATPIPRSLALALYGELDVSLISQLPAGRKEVLTKVVSEDQREKAYEFIRAEIKKGRQVFVICPLIDLSDKLGVKSVKEEFEKLDKIIFPDLAIGLLHGRLKAEEKEKVMADFLAGRVKILVSTSVVEVGVDVPNATIMMIEGAERFGLAQLHQFRGRVGRSDQQSYCFLFTENSGGNTEKRLSALVNCHDGFALAKMDLKFRGPGEFYGTRQKGFPELKIASLFDYELMKIAKAEAEKIVEKDEKLDSWPLLKEKIGEWEKRAHLE